MSLHVHVADISSDQQQPATHPEYARLKRDPTSSHHQTQNLCGSFAMLLPDSLSHGTYPVLTIVTVTIVHCSCTVYHLLAAVVCVMI